MTAARWNRRDIIDAWMRLESDYNVNGWLHERPSNRRRLESCGVQVHRMTRGRRYDWPDTLTANAHRIYRNAEKRLNLEDIT